MSNITFAAATAAAISLVSHKAYSMDMELQFQGPGNVEDYDALAKEAGRCFKDAISKVINSKTLSAWQEAFGEKLEQLTGAKRLVDEKATKAAQQKDPKAVRYESWTTYIRRTAKALKDKGLSLPEGVVYEVVAQEVADTILINPELQRRPSTVEAVYLEKATAILGRDKEGIEAAVARILGTVPAFRFVYEDKTLEDGTTVSVPEVESLALGIKAFLNSDL